MPLEQAYAFAGRTMAENMMAKDAEVSIGTFIEKQPMPTWSDLTAVEINVQLTDFETIVFSNVG